MFNAAGLPISASLAGLVLVCASGCTMEQPDDAAMAQIGQDAVFAQSADPSGPIDLTQAIRGTKGPVEATSKPLPDRIEKGPYFLDPMIQYRKKRWFISDGWSNGDYAMNDWRRGQVKFKGSLRLTMGTNRNSSYPFSSGEVQSRTTHGHGYFETTMRAAKGSGLVSGFFTYTGAPFNQPWNEIDIEILGAKPREILLSYHYKDERVSHVHQLGFDASEGFHTYGFDWQPGHIEWYVDGQPVFRATADDLTLPNIPQKIYLSLLGSRTLADWAGPFDETALPASVEYVCVAKTRGAAINQPCWKKQMEATAGAN